MELEEISIQLSHKILPEEKHNEIIVFLDMTQCNLVESYQLFGRTYHLHLQKRIINCSSRMKKMRNWEQQPKVPIVLEVGWAPQPVWTLS
jgi:hypothetical protein